MDSSSLVIPRIIIVALYLSSGTGIVGSISSSSSSTSASASASASASSVIEMKEEDLRRSWRISKKDITTPITTVPTITTPSSTDPNPLIPITSTPPDPPSPAASWCVASQSASHTALQAALDYACGHVSAYCSAIQPAASCYYPNTLRDHASFAFNAYYQNNPIPSSCNFGGIALTTSTNPSKSTCQYPSTSTSASVLNTTNSRGSTVYGAVPSTPTTSSAVQSQLVSLRSASYLIAFATLYLNSNA